MYLFQLAITVTLLVDTILGVGVFYINPRRPANQAFLLLCLTIDLWLACLACGSLAVSRSALEFWMRQSGTMAALLPAAIDVLRMAISAREGYRSNIRFRLMVWLLVTLPIAFLCQTSFFLQGSIQKPGEFAIPIYGPGNLVYMAFLLLAFLVLIHEFIRDLQTASGMQRAELHFVLLGCGAGLFSGVFLCQVLPALMQNWELAQLGPVAGIFLAAFIAYGVATRKILDVPDVLRRIFAYSILTVALAVLYLVVWQAMTWLVPPVLRRSVPFDHLVATLAVIFSMAPVHGWMQQFAARLFIRSPSLDINTTIQNASRILQTIHTLDRLLEQFGKMITHVMGVELTLILLPEGAVFKQRYPATAAAAVEINETDPLVTCVQDNREPLTRDMVRRMRYSERLAGAGNRLAALRADIAVGIISKERLVGLLLLGPRLSGRIYGANEQNVLQVLCDQLAVALENARLYTHVQNEKLYNEFLVDNLISGVIAIDGRRRVMVFNREAQRMTGLTAAQVLDQPVESLPRPLPEIIRTTLRSKKSIRDYETELIRPGSPARLPIQLGCSLFQRQDTGGPGILLVCHDLTAMKKLELQIRHSDRLASLGTLAAGMAHEIKNPLVTIKTFTQLLPGRYQDEEFRQSFSTLVGQEVNRIDALVNDLLRLARPAKPELAVMHLHPLLEKSLTLMQQQLLHQRIALQRALASPDDLILGDGNALNQMFINLFLNAVEAMPEGGRLSVNTQRVDEREPADRPAAGEIHQYIRVSIADTGLGISAENLPNIFDPFFTTKDSGTGLGLSVAHRIALEHRGRIEVESKESHGTTFYVMLPLCAKETKVDDHA